MRKIKITLEEKLIARMAELICHRINNVTYDFNNDNTIIFYNLNKICAIKGNDLKDLYNQVDRLLSLHNLINDFNDLVKISKEYK